MLGDVPLNHGRNTIFFPVLGREICPYDKTLEGTRQLDVTSIWFRYPQLLRSVFA